IFRNWESCSPSQLVVVIAAIVIATPYGTASRAAGDTGVRHGRQRSVNSRLRGTDAEHYSILSRTEQHHQASKDCQPQQLAHLVLPLFLNPFQPFAGEAIFSFFRQSKDRPQTHEEISAPELRRNFTDASRGLPVTLTRRHAV